MSQEFIVGVADVVVRDPANSNAVILHGKALVDTTLTVSMDSSDIRAGKRNEKIFQYVHTKTFDVKLTSATFEYKYLAMSNGTSTFSTGSNSVLCVECKQFNGSNQAVLTHTPDANTKVYYIDSNGNGQEVTNLNGDTVTIANSANLTYRLIYNYTGTTDKISLGSTSAPKIITVDLLMDIYNQTGLAGQLQVHIPRVQLNGNFELSLTPDGVSSTPLEGSALGYSVDDCADNVYAEINRIYIASLSPQIETLAIAPSAVTLDISDGDTQLLAVWAVYDNNNTALLDNADVTFTSSDEAKATVALTGVVTPVAAGSAEITATFSTFSAICKVTVQA